MSLPYYHFYPGDYARDTRHLSLMQHGAYRLLIDLYMDRGAPLRNDLPYLYRWLHAESVEEKAAVQFILTEFFLLTDNVWTHKRCEAELLARGTAYENKVKGAAKAREAKAAKAKLISEQESTLISELIPGHNQNQNQNQNQKDLNHLPKPSRKKPRAVSAAKTVETWEAYRSAYSQRYGIEPVRNAQVSGMLSKVVDRLGAVEAPAVAAYYVEHERSQYVASNHSVSLLLRDCESLRTDWARGTQTTDTAARDADRLAGKKSMWNKILADSGGSEK